VMRVAAFPTQLRQKHDCAGLNTHASLRIK
jgi:hypothetical protein